MKDMRLKKLMASFLFVVCLATNCCLALPEEKDSCDIEQSVYKQTKDDDTYDSEQFVGKQIAKDFGKFAGISFLSNLFLQVDFMDTKSIILKVKYLSRMRK